jgi:hypothetical protein
VIRFGITDYDTLNVWFNDFYAPYINAKFSFEPLEPQSAFTRLDEKTDLSRILRTRDTRIARGGAISVANTLYMLVDDDGVIYDPGEGTKVGVFVDAITEEMYVEHRGRRLMCAAVGKRERQDVSGVQDRRDLQYLLSDMTLEDAARTK